MKSPLKTAWTALDLTRSGQLEKATTLIRKTLSGVGGTGSQTDTADARSSRSPMILPTLQRPAKITPSSTRSDADNTRFITCTFASSEGTRRYKLFVPSTYDGQPRPLIVMLHGCTQSPNDFAAGTQMNVLGEESGCFVAYPEQTASANPSKCWNWFSSADQHRDRGEPSIIAGIAQQIAAEYAVDRERMYIAGMSAGGAAAAVVAKAYPEIFAAVGIHSGIACGLASDVASAFAVMKSGPPAHSRAARKSHRASIPTIVFQGDRDATVHPRNAERFAEQLDLQTCTKSEVDQVRGGRSCSVTTYTTASGERMYEQWTIEGAGHMWSGGDAAGSYTDARGPVASRELLRFFLSHRLA